MSIVRFKEAKNSLKPIKISINRVQLTLSSTIVDLAIVWDRQTSHHATSGQLSCQILSLRRVFVIEENTSLTGPSTTARAPRLCGPPLHIGQTFHMLGHPWIKPLTSAPHLGTSHHKAPPLIKLRLHSISVGGRSPPISSITLPTLARNISADVSNSRWPSL